MVLTCFQTYLCIHWGHIIAHIKITHLLKRKPADYDCSWKIKTSLMDESDFVFLSQETKCQENQTQFLEVWSTEDRLTWQTVINLLQTWRKNAITMSLCFWKHIQKSTFMQQRKKQGKTHLFCLPSQQPQTVTNTGTLVLRENILIYLSGISLHMYDICIANIHISYKYTHTQKNYTYI